MNNRQQTFAKQLEEEGLKKSQELEVKRKKQEIDKKLGELVSRYVEARSHYGDNHMMTVTLGKFLEIASKMSEVIKMVDNFNIINAYVFELASFLNSSVSLHRSLQSTAMSTKSGFFDRIKEDMDRRRALANIRGTFKSIKANILGVAKLATSMTKEFQTLSDDLIRDLDFGDGEKGVGQSSGPLNLSPEIAARLNAEMAAKSGGNNQAPFGGGGVVPPSNKSGGSGSSGYDDIL